MALDFNCQKGEQELLEKIFMLMAENQRLQYALKHQANSSHPSSGVLERIANIEKQLSSELQNKDKRIEELYNRIKGLHNTNKQLSQKNTHLLKKIEQIEEQYRLQISTFKAESNYYKINYDEERQSEKKILVEKVEKLEGIISENEEKIKNFQTTCFENNQQIEQLNKLICKEEGQKLKWEKEAKRYEEKKQNMKVQMKEQLEKMRSEWRTSLNEKEKEIESIKKRKIEVEKEVMGLKESSVKKGEKLKEYDQKYNTYCSKMNTLTSECKKLKEINVSLNIQIESFEKEKVLLKKQIKEQQQNFTKSTNLYNQKLKQLNHSITKTQTENLTLKDEIRISTINNQQNCQQLENQKNKAVHQWEELRQEMGKQKTIISSLEKEIETQRKKEPTEEIVRKIMKQIKNNEEQSENSSKQSIRLHSQESEEHSFMNQPYMFQKNEKRHYQYQQSGNSSEFQRQASIIKERNSNIGLKSNFDSCEECSQKQTRVRKKYDYSDKFNSKEKAQDQQNSLTISRVPYETRIKVGRSLSTKKIHEIDNKENQIQKYLSFEMRPRQLLSHSSSDRKFNQARPQSDRMKTENSVHQDEKQILVEKMDRINSWRNDSMTGKSYGHFKRSVLNSGRFGRYGQKKEDMNEIIKRKCQFILDK